MSGQQPKDPSVKKPAVDNTVPQLEDLSRPIPPEVGQTVDGFFKDVISRPNLRGLLKKLADH